MSSKRNSPATTRANKGPGAVTAAGPTPTGPSVEERAALTVNGEPIPEHLAHAIPYAQTDQGIAEANRGRKLPAGAGVRVIRAEGFDRAIEHRMEAGDGKVEAFTAPDPLKEAIDKVREPGFRYKALSETMISRRGLRGFEVCKDAKTGEPVRMANMVIGRMPIPMAEQRNKHYQDLGNTVLADSEAYHKAQQEKLIRDGQAQGLSVLRSGEQLHGEDSGGRARDVTVGLRSHRGNSHFIEEAA